MSVGFCSSWREVALLVLGMSLFLAIIVGLVLNTTFLILREIRRNEQHMLSSTPSRMN